MYALVLLNTSSTWAGPLAELVYIVYNNWPVTPLSLPTMLCRLPTVGQLALTSLSLRRSV